MSDTTVNPDSSVYYTSGYWNDLARVREYLNRRATDDPGTNWWEHLAAWRGRPFAKALVLNCGNGWVERDLVRHGVVKEAVGIDFIDDLLASARDEAAKEDLPLKYHQMDTNTARFPEGEYELVVNFAAAHHIARLDRVFRRLAEMLPDDGVLVSWDYIGSHRNQYDTRMWEAAWQTNRRLPEQLRQELNYPHLPTMLATDPTEAIHSELILTTMRRYFDIVHMRALGGAIGYPLLTFNNAIHSRDPEQVASAVASVLDSDAAFTDRDPERNTLFAYLIAQPDKTVLSDGARLAEWAREEDERESAAEHTGGAYYPPTMLGELFEQLYSARDALAARSVAAPGRTPAPSEEEQRHGVGPSPAIDPRRRARLRDDPGLRARVARLPGARPAYRWLRQFGNRLRG